MSADTLGSPRPPGVGRKGGWAPGSLTGLQGHSRKGSRTLVRAVKCGGAQRWFRGVAARAPVTTASNLRRPRPRSTRPAAAARAGFLWFPLERRRDATPRAGHAPPLPAAHAQSDSGRRGLLSAARPRPAPRPRAAERSAQGGGGRIHGAAPLINRSLCGAILSPRSVAAASARVPCSPRLGGGGDGARWAPSRQCRRPRPRPSGRPRGSSARPRGHLKLSAQLL